MTQCQYPRIGFHSLLTYKEQLHITRLSTVTRPVQWRNKFQLVPAPSVAKQIKRTSTRPVVGEQ